MRSAIIVSAYSSTLEIGTVSEDTATNRIGWSAGFTFWNEGGVVISGGNFRAAVEIAVCTSSAAPSILRFKSNCSVIWVVPRKLVEVMALMPEITENWRSSGVATEAAIVSGLAPGNVAVTEIV